MVEFMIVLPVLLLLMFGISEGGRMIMRYNTLTKALQDGARHAAAYGIRGASQTVNIDAGLDAEIRNLVVYGNVQGTGAPVLYGFTPAQVQVTVPEPGRIQVAATYPYVSGIFDALPTFGFGSGSSLSFDMSAAVTQRAL